MVVVVVVVVIDVNVIYFYFISFSRSPLFSVNYVSYYVAESNVGVVVAAASVATVVVVVVATLSIDPLGSANLFGVSLHIFRHT